MEIIIPIIISTIAGLSTVVGGLLIFLKIKKEHINSFITFCLSLSLTTMIFISIFDLMPNSSMDIIGKYGFFKGIIIITITFSIGVLIINMINKKIERITVKKNDLYRVGILSMIALALHNLPEGIITFMSSYKDISLGISLGIAIMIHNIPEGISIAIPIYYSTKKRGVAIRNTLLSGLSEPLGAVLAYILLYKYIDNELINLILILVSGIMITISINKLLPEALSYKKPRYVFLGLICGFILIIFNHFVLSKLFG